MSVRLYLEDLPEGHAAAGRLEGRVAVVIVDRSHLQRAKDAGDLEFGVRIANDMLRALEHGPAGQTLSVAS